MPSELSERQRALLEALREAEGRATPVDVEQLAESTGYSVASIRTYFSKKLDGVIAYREDQGWRVRGAIRCSEAEFARHLTQKAGASGEALRTEGSWRVVVRKLLYEGSRRGYTLGPDELRLLRAIVPEGTVLPAGPAASAGAGVSEGVGAVDGAGSRLPGPRQPRLFEER